MTCFFRLLLLSVHLLSSHPLLWRCWSLYNTAGIAGLSKLAHSQSNQLMDGLQMTCSLNCSQTHSSVKIKASFPLLDRQHMIVTGLSWQSEYLIKHYLINTAQHLSNLRGINSQQSIMSKSNEREPLGILCQIMSKFIVLMKSLGIRPVSDDCKKDRVLVRITSVLQLS